MMHLSDRDDIARGVRRGFLCLDLSDVTKMQIATKQRYSLHLQSRFMLAIPPPDMAYDCQRAYGYETEWLDVLHLLLALPHWPM